MRSITRKSRSMRSSLRSQRSGWAAYAGVVAPTVAAAISEAMATRQRFRVMPIIFRAHESFAVMASLALSERGAGSRRALGSQHDFAARRAGLASRPMDLYLVSRRRAWLSEEELAATADCMPALLATFGGDIRWVRSYVF